MIYYRDDEIVIRDVCHEDLVDLFTVWIDKEVNMHDPRPMPKSSKELVAECVNYCNRFDIEIINENMDIRRYQYFIITTIEGRFIGFVNFFSIDKVKKQGEMGVAIGDKRYQNKGIAYTAILVVMKYIFETMDITRIYIETAETNIPALRLFDKLNFIKCGEYFDEDNIKAIVMEKIFN